MAQPRLVLLSLCLLSLFCRPEARAQICTSGKEGYLWYFGDSLGLDFNTSPPTILTDSRMDTYEASTIVSDSAGHLLFYSNGEYVWNRNHQLMPAVDPASGGMKLKGDASATHILALAQPGAPNRYYIFYMEATDASLVGQPADTLRKMYYAIIDMSADGGLGDVVLKNSLLFNKTTEKVAATRHCNGRDWWVMTAESGSNKLMAWLIDPAGLQSAPVISQVGKISSPLIAAKVGTLKFSPNGHLLLKIVGARQNLTGATWDAYFEIYRFDNSTGIAVQPLLIWENTRSFYGGEFSPDNTKLYLDAWTPGDTLYQYDLCQYDPEAIRASRISLGKAASNTGQMQLAPDGQIYITSAFRQFLSLIRYPNREGAACQYEPQAIPLPRQALLGLPTFPANYYAPGKPYIQGEDRCASVCTDSLRRYYVVGQCDQGATYQWSATGGSVVAQQADTVWIKWDQAGQQSVAVRKTWACGERSDTLKVDVDPCTLPPASVCLSGQEGHIWYFGDSLGLDFHTSPPTILTDSRMRTYEAGTIVSDAMGNVLFYSDGEYVWNRNHQLMPGAVGVNKLKGSESATQILAVPQPGNPNIYFLFYMEVFDNVWQLNVPADTTRKMYYAIIDMAANGGLGDVISKNNVLFIRSNEKVAAVRHCNGEDWWILTSESGSNRLFSWLLTAAGLNPVPVVSSVGKGNSGLIGSKAGAFKVSPDGGLILRVTPARASFWASATYDGFAEIMRFDNSNGEASSPILIGDGFREIYSGSFSNDNSKLYIHVWQPWDSLFQYDLCKYDSAAIVGSKVNLGQVASNTGQMQLAPDGQIYITSVFREFLSVIRYPNRKGLACQYEPQAIPLPRQALLGLPTFPASYYAPGKPYIQVENQCVPVCIDSLRRYYVVGQCDHGATYQWSASGGTVVAQQADTAWIKWTEPGLQSVAVRKAWACGERSDTLSVEVENCALCTPVTTLLSATTCDPFLTGTDTLLLATAAGCDSLIVTTTMLQPAFIVQQTAATCDPALAGSDTLFLQTVSGCDSLIVITTTLQPAFLVQQTAATCDPALAGSDTLFLQTAYGCDSLIVTTTTLQPAFIVQQTVSTCDPALAGSDTLFLQTTYGCDSLIVTTTTLQPAFIVQQTAATCDPALAGSDTLFLQTVSGCDSLIVTTTNWMPALLEAGSDQTISLGDSVWLSAVTNLSPVAIGWQPPQFVACPHCLETFAFPLRNTLFTLRVVDVNGCIAEAQVRVTVTDRHTLYLPNVFMPGSTLGNDRFTVYADDQQVRRVLRLAIYDRWGEPVFGQTNFPPNSAAAGWNGDWRGKPCPPGVYVYYLEIEWSDGTTSTYKGDLTLIR